MTITAQSAATRLGKTLSSKPRLLGALKTFVARARPWSNTLLGLRSASPAAVDPASENPWITARIHSLLIKRA